MMEFIGHWWNCVAANWMDGWMLYSRSLSSFCLPFVFCDMDWMEGLIVEPGEVEVADVEVRVVVVVVVVRIEDEELEVKDNVDDEASVVV